MGSERKRSNVTGSWNNEGEFPLFFLAGEIFLRFGNRAVENIFMHFGQFPADNDLAVVAENLAQAFQGLLDSVGRFVKNDRPHLNALKRAEEFFPAFFVRRVTQKREFVRGNTGGGNKSGQSG